MPYANFGTLCAKLATPCVNLGMLSRFAGMPCEDEDEIREESRDPRALLRVPYPSRGRGRECVGSSSERETTRHAYLGMPREPLETPNEDSPMRRGFVRNDGEILNHF